ncbi:MAG: LuxR family transcriptional regulator, partial [Coriobacteriia bacterium]|nr:LuxR family transcriptional regulator [Coriobacteriia bacterium]
AQVVEEQSGLAMFSALSVFTMLLVAIFVFANRSPETGWERVRPGEAERTMTELDDAATSLARRFRLSPREVEVLFLLAKGRNRSYIAHELAIGDETVKSHVKSLYRKMGLHSQQELIDLVEAEVGFGRVGIGGDAL